MSKSKTGFTLPHTCKLHTLLLSILLYIKTLQQILPPKIRVVPTNRPFNFTSFLQSQKNSFQRTLFVYLIRYSGSFAAYLSLPIFVPFQCKPFFHPFKLIAIDKSSLHNKNIVLQPENSYNGQKSKKMDIRQVF